MSDDELIIRHVRLCQCGKPAGHGTICAPERRTPGLDPDNVERVASTFEELTTERAQARYERRRREFDSDRRQRFARMDALSLHRWITETTAAISTVKAGSIEPSRASSSDTSAPAQQQTFDDDPRWREHMAVIRRRLELAAELVLEAEGHSTVASTMNMFGEEKDKLILASQNEGLRAQAVVDRLGSHVAGTAETVRRVRRREGYDHLGYPRLNDNARAS